MELKKKKYSQLGTKPRRTFLELTSYLDGGGGKMDDETGQQHHIHRLPTQWSQSLIKIGIHTIKKEYQYPLEDPLLVIKSICS